MARKTKELPEKPKKPPHPPATTMGERIRAARERAGLTQVQAAEKAGLSGGYWPQMESGLREPPVKTLAKIAVALGCRTADLLP